MAKHSFTLEDIEGAERLVDVSYTPQERQQMLENLEGQIASARARRAVRLANDEPMATRFDPRLPTFAMPAPPRPATLLGSSGDGAAGQ